MFPIFPIGGRLANLSEDRFFGSFHRVIVPDVEQFPFPERHLLSPRPDRSKTLRKLRVLFDIRKEKSRNRVSYVQIVAEKLCTMTTAL